MAPFTHPEFAQWAEHLSHARNGHSRPIANNTKVRWGGEDSICFDLHSTAVVTLRRDGSRVLRTGGWLTVTTKDRIHQFGSRYVSGPTEPHDTSRGWTVRCEDDPKDPHPTGSTSCWGGRATRSVPKPFHAADPGPEPVDDGVGCIAGTSETFEAGEFETVYDWSTPPKSSQHVTNRFYSDRSGPARMVHRVFMTTTYYGKPSYKWGTDCPSGAEYKQCPHCKAFEERHERWHVGYHGKRWGRGRGQGHELMTRMLKRYGTREDWREAYLTDLRETRELNAKIGEWSRRNFITFYDGIEVTSQGRVPLKAKRAHCRQLEAEAREERRRERVHRRVTRETARIQAKFDRQRAREREVRRQVAHALAESLASEMALKQAEYPIWRQNANARL